jgi:hypothetical protein
MKGGYYQIGRLVAWLCVFACSEWSASSAWILRRPSPTANHLTGLASGDGKCVAVGDLGTILLCADGTNWSRVPSHVKIGLYGVAYGKAGFVAVGEQGTILRSVHGNGWVRYRFAPQETFYGVTYNAGRYVVVGDEIVTSEDGAHWTKAALSDGYGPWWGVTYGNDLFVATKFGKSTTSNDGLVWTSHEQWDTNLLQRPLLLGKPVFGGGKFVTTGLNYCISEDGTNWAVAPYDSSRSPFEAVAYGGGQFVGIGLDRIVYSSVNGDTWSPYGPGLPNAALPYGSGPRALIFANGQFVAAGIAGEILSSRDGANWESQTDGPGARLKGITYNGNEFVAVGENGTILSSQDGKRWIQSSIAITNDLNCITYGGTSFVVGGRHGTVLTSNDATNWVTQQSLGTRDIAAITFGQGRFVGVANTDEYDTGIPGGVIFTSQDGADWMLAAQNEFYSYTGVAYGNGLFMALATWNTGWDYVPELMLSKDGVNWTQSRYQFPEFSGVRTIAFGNDRFVAVGNYGDIFVSTNGKSWVKNHLKGFADDWPLSINYAYNSFLITKASGRILRSWSGLNWTSQEIPFEASIYGIAYGNGSYVGVGDFGVILQTQSFPR